MSAEWTQESLEDLKYRQLQSVAKKYGVKANLPKAQLIQEILQSQPRVQPQPPKADLNRTFEKDRSPIKKDSPNGIRASTPKSTPTANTPKSTKKVNTPKSIKKANTPKSIKKVNTPKSTKKAVTPKPIIKAGTPKSIKKAHTTPKSTKKALTPKSAKKLIATPKSKINSAVLVDLITDPKICTPSTGTKKLPAYATPTLASSRRSIAAAASSATLGSARKSLLASKTKKDPLRAKLASVTKAKKKPSLSSSAADGNAGLNNSGIPRFVSKRVPNFAKMHAQQFDQMDSLDVYLSKKKEKASAVKDKFVQARQNASRHQNAMERIKKMTPAEENKTLRRSPRNGSSENQPPAPTAFVPSNLTLNSGTSFNFGARKTQHGMGSTAFVFTASPKTTSKSPARKENKILSNLTNTGTPGSAKKGAFNLKASLAKPLGYKPHKGKLKSFEEKKSDRVAMGTKLGGVSKNKNKSIIKGVRLNKRAELLLQRRGMSTDQN